MTDVKLTIEDYEFMDEILRNIGILRVKPKEKSEDIFRLGLQAPRMIKGSEVCYRYSNKEYTLKVWPSYVPEEQKFRAVGKDSGWVIITQGDELVYSTKPMKRTTREDFIMKILRYAWVNKFKIDNIPLCPCKDCNGRMFIFRKKGTHCYMYACNKAENHHDGKWRFRSWDYGLKEKSKAFLEIGRKATAKYKAKMKTLGKNPIPAAIIRKKWISVNKNNIIRTHFK